MDREALVEKIAGVIADVSGDGCETGDLASCPDDVFGLCCCRLGAEAVIAAIESAGPKIMGRELTDEMITNAIRASNAFGASLGSNEARTILRAAWDAAPTYTDTSR